MKTNQSMKSLHTRPNWRALAFITIFFIAISANSYAQDCLMEGNITVTYDCQSPTEAGLSARVSGGTLPYSYRWSNGMTTKETGAIPVGDYTLTVSDAAGCSFERAISIAPYQNLIVDARISATSSAGAEDGKISIKLKEGNTRAKNIKVYWTGPGLTGYGGLVQKGLKRGHYVAMLNDGHCNYAQEIFVP